MKLFFATDEHGSMACFKKLLRAREFYSADVVILGGDMTGKMVVPIRRKGGGKYVSVLSGVERELVDQQELNAYGLPPIYGPTGVRGFSVVCCSIPGSSPVP